MDTLNDGPWKSNSLYKHGNFWISMLDFRRITFGSSGCNYVTCLRKVCFSPTGVLSDVTFATWSVLPLWTCAEPPLLTMHVSYVSIIWLHFFNDISITPVVASPLQQRLSTIRKAAICFSFVLNEGWRPSQTQLKHTLRWEVLSFRQNFPSKNFSVFSSKAGWVYSPKLSCKCLGCPVGS